MNRSLKNLGLPTQNSENPSKPPSARSLSTVDSAAVSGEASPPPPDHLQALSEHAESCVEAANTRKAYASDWKHFTAWCRRSGQSPLPADPQVVGLYITACAAGHDTVPDQRAAAASTRSSSISTIERRLSALAWSYTQAGEKLDRRDHGIATALAGIRSRHAAAPRRKEAILAEDLIAMLETLDCGSLRGIRDRAMLLIGFAGALRRSEITGLDLGRNQTQDGAGWIEIVDQGLLVTVLGKTGWRTVKIGRGSSDSTCPVAALERWIQFARLARGPLFRRVTGKGKAVGAERLNDQEVARLVKKTALAAGIRGDHSLAERKSLFSGHSLRAGLTSSAEADERSRDRFRANLTKAAEL